MASPKSLLRRIAVDTVKNAHNCQHSAKHRLIRGDKRLQVWTNPRSPENFCVACALSFIQNDIARLHSLAAELKSDLQPVQMELETALLPAAG